MAERLNVLFIEDDQHNARLLSCAGTPIIRTPHIDRIAQNGVRFTNAFCPSAICQASRVSMFTGMYTHSTGAYENDGLIDRDLRSLVDVIREAGWHTTLIGKSHFVPQWRLHGFDEVHVGDFCDCRESMEENEYYLYLREHGWDGYYDLLGEALKWAPLGAMPSRLPLEMSQEYWIAEETISFLRRRAASEKPFFCYVSFSRPHNPWMPSAPFHEMYDPDSIVLPPTHPDDWKKKPYRVRDRWTDPSLTFYYPAMNEKVLRRALALYYGLISQIDSQVGRILDALEEMSMLDETVIVFCSDHGDMAGEHGIVDKGIPTLDGVWKTPLIISAPSLRRYRNQAREQLVNLVDVMPTLFEILGLEVPRQVEGRSLMQEITRPDDPGREAVFFEYRHVKTVRTKKWALSYYSPGEEEHLDYSHYLRVQPGEGELYDLENDPHQFFNLYDDPSLKEVRLRLTEMLLEWMCNTERVHRHVRPYRGPCGVRFDFGGMTPGEYRNRYMKDHPLL